MVRVLALFDQEAHAGCLFAAAKLLSSDVDLFRIVPDRIDTTALALRDKVSSYDYVLFPSTVFYRALVPALARLLDAVSLTDVAGITGDKCFLRYVSAGQAMTKVKVERGGKPLTMTVVLGAFDASGKASFKTMPLSFGQSMATFIKRETEFGERPSLSTAKYVIGVGLGVSDACDLSLIFKLADKLNAAVCATRPLIDQGLFPSSLQVGQTGTSIAPDVYLALGISGAVQHLAGIKNARKVIAINTDPSAPIFKFAHVGYVGDLKDVAEFLIKG